MKITRSIFRLLRTKNMTMVSRKNESLSICRFLRSRNIVVIFVILIIWYWLQKDNETKSTEATYRRSVHMRLNILDQNLSPHPMSSPKLRQYSHRSDYFVPESLMKRDWHNYTQIIEENKRNGFGEHGKLAKLPKEDEALEQELMTINGLNAALSDKIALNRSLPDVRHPACKKKLYLESLPTVSVIIAFNDDHWSMLMRTLYTILHRSPEQLIKEIILVDDASQKEFLKEKLENHLKTHMPKVKLLRLATRSGVVKSRLFGAKAATADVLVFLDSQIEANVNWLPPLLEPIALDYRLVMCSYVDDINFQTLEYKIMDEGARGAFDWLFFYKRLPLLPKDRKNMPAPFQTPIMMGGPFAISRIFFWELGGFDPGFEIWGGEQFEFSLKVWQCGGRIMDVPCSRVGHVFRLYSPYPTIISHGTYIYKNFRRTIDVWMDEYAEYLYMRHPEWRDVDPGDLTEQKAIRKKLKCKPFKWFLTQVAFDLSKHYPMIEPKPFAEGRIRPLIDTNLCVGRKENGVHLTRCDESDDQKYMLSWHKDIQTTNGRLCWDVPESMGRGAIQLNFCHHSGGNQQWRYYEVGKKLLHLSGTCLDHDIKTREVFVYPCFDKAKTQQWLIDVIHRDQMAKWNERNRVTGPIEKWTD